jgi:hypothetical protein
MEYASDAFLSREGKIHRLDIRSNQGKAAKEVNAMSIALKVSGPRRLHKGFLSVGLAAMEAQPFEEVV